MKNQIVIIKIGGEIINNPDNLNLICKEIAKLKQKKIHIVLVHGGGQQVNQIEKKLGNVPNIVNGRRVTDQNALESIKMVIAGKINIEIVSSLQCYGVDAVGLSGADNRILNVYRRLSTKMDYGFVGDIKSVNPQLIFTLLNNNLIPVIAPLAADEKGIIYNINADTVASAIALSLKAAQWIILTNIDGIYDEAGNTLPYLTCHQIRELIAKGVITDGMLPKVESILAAIQSGIKSVHIMNGFKPERLSNFFHEKSLGTIISTMG